MRLWLAGTLLASVAASEQVGLEDLGGCPEAEAFARRGIQASAKRAQCLLGQAVRIGVAAEPTPKPLVGVFHRTFLLGQLRPAEPCLRANLSLQVRPVDEFGATIEGDRSAGMPGRGRQSLRNLRHDRLRALLLVLQHDQEVARALDHGGDMAGPYS